MRTQEKKLKSNKDLIGLKIRKNEFVVIFLIILFSPRCVRCEADAPFFLFLIAKLIKNTNKLVFLSFCLVFFAFLCYLCNAFPFKGYKAKSLLLCLFTNK